MVQYEVKRLQTEGFETVYCHAGEGNKETIIFLHGSGPGANGESNWSVPLQVFGEKYHVIAPDLVGFGNTEIPENTNLTFWQWTTLRIKQILALMDHYGVEKATLVGNSMGGVISLNAVMHSSHRFEKIFLMGSGGGATNGPTAEITRMKNFFNDPTIEAFRNLITWFVYDESALGDRLEEIVQSRYENLMRPGVDKLYPKLFPANPLELLLAPSALRRIKQPVLMLHGYEDRFVPKESSLSILEHLPNAELVLIKGCGHWAQIEKADRFIQLLEQFLETKHN
jgi:2-hydroxymuconate-semialdehyde hydrolase